MKRLYSLRARLVLWTVTLQAILLVVLAAVVLFAVQSLQQRQIDETLTLGATQLNAVIDVQGDHYTAEVADVVALRRAGVLTWVLTPAGTLVETVGDADELPLPSLLPNSGQFMDTTLADGVAARLLVSPLQEGSDILGTLVLALPLKSNQLFSRFLLWSLALAIPIVLLLSTAGGFFLAGRALAPVSSITETARQISAAGLSQRLQLDLPDDEIGQLAHTFDAMLERLDQAFQRERQLTADVSHELRTPLAMLKTQLSLARSRPRDVQTLQAMMTEMEGDVDRMTQLIAQMLTLTTVEHGMSVALSTVALAPLLIHLIDQMAPVAAEKGVELQVDVPASSPLRLQGDSDGLRQVFTNLLENAIKYTPTGGQVTLSATCQDRQIQIAVTDNGIGIPAEHLPHLFKRFYRVDQARARGSGGFGLGLAISQAIVQMHGGRIECHSAAGEGTTFTVDLPINIATNEG